ncbi:MAG TPA: hypothetical protein VFQ61_21550 [Polyangiaceae bacterium]|nr:hypothetical protein [Polyangiaceae bacterium]
MNRRNAGWGWVFACLPAMMACNAVLDIDQKKPGELPPTSTTGSFELTASSSVRLVAGGQAALEVTVQRRDGFGGPVTALVNGLPHGVRAEPLVLAASQTSGKVLFRASESAEFGRSSISILGASQSLILDPISVELVVQGTPGSLDETFGDHGRVVLAPTGATELGVGAGGLRIAQDGSVLLCGRVRTASSERSVLLARLTSEGELDETFGSEGWVFTNSQRSQSDECNSAILRPSGGVVFAGAASPNGSPGDLMAARFSSTGHASGDFGKSGFITRAFGEKQSSACCVLGGDQDKIIAGGQVDGDALLIRFMKNGEIDASFGSRSGSVIDGAGMRSLAQQSTGHFVAALDSDTFRVARFNPDGQLDESANPQPVGVDVGGRGSSKAVIALVRPDDEIVVVGTAQAETGFAELAVAFLTNTGQLDTSKLSEGWVTSHWGEGDVTVSGAVLQADGGLLVAGETLSADGALLTLTRLEADGSLDTSFGTGGRRTFEMERSAHSIALDALGRVLVVGSAGATDSALVLYRLWP